MHSEERTVCEDEGLEDAIAYTRSNSTTAEYWRMVIGGEMELKNENNKG